MLSHYKVTPASPTLTPSQLQSALAFAEAIIPGSSLTPGADETTIARVEELIATLSAESSSQSVVRGFTGVLSLLDQAVRLQKGKPFHALTRATQQDVLESWEKSPILRTPLHTLAYMLKIVHFDSPRTYTKMGGELRVLANVETQRWEQQIVSAKEWKESRDVECEVVVIGTGAGEPSSDASSPIAATPSCTSKRARIESAMTSSEASFTPTRRTTETRGPWGPRPSRC